MNIDIGIAEEQREEIAAGLARLLADTYVLYLKTHYYHWNVTGPQFNTLHQMFEEQYTELAEAVDVIAERIRALGVYAPGTFGQYTGLTSISEDTEVPSAEDMIRHLVRGQEAVVRTARTVVPVAQDAGDEPTADLATERMRLHEKTAWMLRSMLA
ncbi:MAG: Dps family protein [Bacteroidota bacterium]